MQKPWYYKEIKKKMQYAIFLYRFYSQLIKYKADFGLVIEYNKANWWLSKKEGAVQKS